MIVPSMTDLEILAEVKKDYEEISVFLKSISHNNAYKKRLQWGRPRNGLFEFRINDWKSKGGNSYTFIIKTSGWNEFKSFHFKWEVLTFFKRDSAQNAIRVVFDKDENLVIEIFTSHFIDRYNQRFLKQPFLSRKDVILQFVDRNVNFVSEAMKSSKYDFNIMMATDDGYIFGKNENKDILVCKTFVSREMLFGGQFDDGDFLDEVVVKSKKDPFSKRFNLNAELGNIIGNERAIPTMEEINAGFKMMQKMKEKKASLEREGKEFDLELYELQNQLFLWASKFDWAGGKLKDAEGKVINHPLMQMLSQYLEKSNNNLVKRGNIY